MTVPPTKEGQTALACPCPTRREDLLSNSHSGKSASSWTGRKHTVAAKSDWETTQEKNGKQAFLEQNVSGTCGLSLADRARMQGK